MVFAQSQPEISVTGNVIHNNNQTISKDWKVKEISNAFAIKYRKEKGKLYNHNVYDNEGISVYITHRAKSAEEIQLVFNKIDTPESHEPSGVFSGIFKVDEKLISKMSLTIIKNALTNWKNELTSLTNTYKFTRDKMYIYMEFDNDFSALKSISIGRVQ